MKSFLDQIVEKITKEQPVENLVFILPSRRAGVFLKQSWIQYFKNKSTWLPQIWTIEEFMETVSGFKQLDSITLLFEYYQAYQQTHKTAESFESFLKWAQTVISDLNDVDRNLVSAPKFFEYISSIERMDKWEPKDLSYETDLIENNLLFWKGVEKTYNKLHINLKERKLGSQGMVFRKASEQIDLYLKANNFHFVFAGFNALTKSEEQIMKFVYEEKRASIFWDSDVYYLNDKAQESGVFLREKRKWAIYEKEPFSFIEKSLSQKKNIHVIGTPKQTGQVKLAGTILESLVEKGEKLTETAFVLADENLLEPALNALPEKIDKVNVTMGYPLQNIPLSIFFTSFLKLYTQYIKFNKKGFYYKDVLAFLKNSYCDYLLNDRIEFMEKLVRQNHVFISPKVLEEASPIFKILFSETKEITPLSFIEKTTVLINHLSKDNVLKENSLEMEYLFRFNTIWESLSVMLKEFSFVKEIKTLAALYNQILFNETLSFYGEPLKGLQLMGMLETRLLDFKNIILTSVNEGILPKGRTQNSFIPFDIRKNVGLPTFQENDAIFAYHFYRLIQRAENVYLIYNTENDVYGAGEKSRFLTQLEIELPYTIKHHIAAESTFERPIEALQIQKSPKMMERLYEMAEKGFSPSALNSYIRNPLGFYYQNILRLQDVEEVEETIDARTLGIVVHNTLEDLYKPYLNEILTLEILQKLDKLAEKRLQFHFAEVYKNGTYSKGKNVLIYNVSKRFVQNFLHHEKNEISNGNEIIIKQLEMELKTSIEIDGKTIFIRGFADRIDQYNGIIRVIDYKTGIAEANKLKLKDFEGITSSKEYDKAMQLTLYAYMYLNQFQEKEVQAGILSFRKLKEGVMLLSINKNTHISKESLNDFKPHLDELIREILTLNIPIVENLEERA